MIGQWCDAYILAKAESLWKSSGNESIQSDRAGTRRGSRPSNNAFIGEFDGCRLNDFGHTHGNSGFPKTDSVRFDARVYAV